MNVALLVLGILGALLSSCGWIIERAFKIRWLRRHLAAKADTALRELDKLRGNPSLAFTRDDPAFQVLSSVWPGFPQNLPVHAIGRTVAYISMGPEIKNEIGLTLFDEQLKRIEGFDWTIDAADDLIVAPVEKRFRAIGVTVFWIGIAVTLAATVVRFIATP